MSYLDQKTIKELFRYIYFLRDRAEVIMSSDLERPGRPMAERPKNIS
jgi:hypothetical protein